MGGPGVRTRTNPVQTSDQESRWRLTCCHCRLERLVAHTRSAGDAVGRGKWHVGEVAPRGSRVLKNCCALARCTEPIPAPHLHRPRGPGLRKALSVVACRMPSQRCNLAPSTPKQATPPACVDLDDEPGKGVGCCRVCWELDQVSALLSPCKCAGELAQGCCVVAGWFGGGVPGVPGVGRPWGETAGGGGYLAAAAPAPPSAQS